MKQTVLWLLTATLLLCACGCNKTTTEPSATPDTVVVPPVDDAWKYPTIDFLREELQEHGSIREYDPEKTEHLPSRKDTTVAIEWVDRGPLTYSRLMERVGANGAIVAGYATGTRQAVLQREVPSSYYTVTKFNVTDCYFGEAKEQITLTEGYVLVNENQESYFLSLSGDAYRLKNGQKVLLFLRWSDKLQTYSIASDPFPLSEDYNAYSEDYLKSVLNFYRGDKAEYAIQETTHPDVGEEQPGGKKTARFWPERTISDAELLTEMNDHPLIRTATEYRIALWPAGHIRYTPDHYIDEFYEISMPPE